MDIIRNSVWQSHDSDVLSDGLYRVLDFDRDTDLLILFEIKKERTSKPIPFSLSQFTYGVDSQRITHKKYTPPSYMLIDERKINDEDRKRRDVNYKIIKELVEDKIFVFDYAIHKKSHLLTEYSRKKQIPQRTIRTLLTLYWKHGQDIYALLPAYPNCGAAGKSRIRHEVKLGNAKKNRVLPNIRSKVYILNEGDIENIKKSLTRFHYKTHGETIKKTLVRHIELYFKDEIKKANAENRAPYIPSLKQFTYWNRKLFSKEFSINKKNSKKEIALKMRGLLGSAANTTVLPGDVFEIDSTVADVHLVSSLNRRKVIGRPTIYTVVDRASRMIVGLHVSLYHASWRAARQALANCFMPKKEYCRIFGVSINEDEWPCSHIPLTLMCDNGEMIGLKPQDKMTPLTKLEFAPVGRGDRKSIVERCFGILNDEAIHELTGATRRGKIVKGEPTPQSRACLTIQEVTSVLIREILAHNQRTYEELAYINPLLIEHDLIISPKNSWMISVKQGRFSGRVVTADEVIARLLIPVTANITAGGIQYNNLFYECDPDIASAARVFGRTSCEARIDDNCVDYLYVRFDKNSVFRKHYLLKKRDVFKGKAHLDTDVMADWVDTQKEINAFTLNVFNNSKVKDKINRQGIERLNDISDPRRVHGKDIRRNRKAELDLLGRTNLPNEKNEPVLPSSSNILLFPGREEKQRWLNAKKKQEDAEK
ncbi:transposase [Escherichia coli]